MGDISNKTIYKFQEESILKQYGYSTSEEDNLSDAHRQAILKDILISGRLNMMQLKRIIQVQINIKSSQSRFKNSVMKWKKDLKFLENYYPDGEVQMSLFD